VILDASLCDPNNPIVSSVLCLQRGSYLTSLVGYSIRLDHRNDPINPSRGYYVDVSQDLAGVGGDVNYLRSEIDGAWYHGFNKDFIFSATGSGGYIDGWAGDNVRVNDRFYKGGNSFRGFDTAGLGPRDITNGRRDALGGKAYAIGSLGLTIPTYLPEQYGIKAALFSDFGTVGLLDKIDKQTITGVRIPGIKDDLAFRASAGISIFWKGPLGPIQFDFADVLAHQDYDRTQNFRFSTSTRF
jgi:outer membrane protein insertion porin family